MTNADTVRNFYELGERQDYRDAVAAGGLASFFAQPEFAPFLDAFDPELEISEPFIIAMQAWPTHFDDFRAELVEVIEGDDVLFHEARHYGRARGSSLPLEMNVFNAQWFRDGKLYRWEMYLDRDEALAAAGIKG